jgi:hypothetical protein
VKRIIFCLIFVPPHKQHTLAHSHAHQMETQTTTTEKNDGSISWQMNAANGDLMIQIFTKSSAQTITIKNANANDVTNIISVFSMVMMKIHDPTSFSDDQNDPRIVKIFKESPSNEPALWIKVVEGTAVVLQKIENNNDLREFVLNVGTPGSMCRHYGFSYCTLHKFLQKGQSIIKEMIKFESNKTKVFGFGGGSSSSSGVSSINQPSFSFGGSSSSPFRSTDE